MPEYSSTTITPADGVKTPAMNGSTSGNYELSALKAYILASKGLANGLASLDANGKLPTSQLPDLADDVLVYGSYALLPSPGTAGKLYITADDNKMYRWDDALTTPDYVVLSVDLSDYATEAELTDVKNALFGSTKSVTRSQYLYFNTSTEKLYLRTSTFWGDWFPVSKDINYKITIDQKIANITDIAYILFSTSTPAENVSCEVLGQVTPSQIKKYYLDVVPENDGYVCVVHYDSNIAENSICVISAESTNIYNQVITNTEAIESLNGLSNTVDEIINNKSITGNSVRYLYINQNNVFYERNGNCYTDYYPIKKGLMYDYKFYSSTAETTIQPIVAYSNAVPVNGGSVDRITFIDTSKIGYYHYTFKSDRNGYLCVARYNTLQQIEFTTVNVYGEDSEYKSILVDPNGYGNYTSLVEALKSITNNEPTNVYVREGTYILSDEWTSEELSNANYPSGFCGTDIPMNVNIIGIGDKTKIIITASSNSSYSYDTTWRHISTLNPRGNNTIKNVTIKSVGLRYAVHEDFDPVNLTQNYIDCNVEFYGSFTGHAIGCGSANGATYNFINCYIKPSLGMHGHSNNTAQTKMNIDGCVITGAVALIDYDMKLKFPITIKNSSIGCIIYSKYDSSANQYMDIKFFNGKVPFRSNVEDVIYDMDGIVYKGTESAISKGTPVKKVGTSFEFVSAMASNDGENLFYGIALEDMPSFSGNVDSFPKRVITSGWVSSAIVGLGGLNVGDRIGVVNGALSVVQTDGIGIVDYIIDSVAYIRLLK